jgi:hypothetical protein
VHFHPNCQAHSLLTATHSLLAATRLLSAAGGYGVEPFCRIYVENALCNATQGLISARPWLELSILCSQFTSRVIPARCISVKGEAGPARLAEYLALWERQQDWDRPVRPIH